MHNAVRGFACDRDTGLNIYIFVPENIDVISTRINKSYIQYLECVAKMY